MISIITKIKTGFVKSITIPDGVDLIRYVPTIHIHDTNPKIASTGRRPMLIGVLNLSSGNNDVNLSFIREAFIIANTMNIPIVVNSASVPMSFSKLKAIPTSATTINAL